MSSLRAKATAELQRRVAVLPREIERFQLAAAANAGGFGIHASQLGALQVLMDELIQRQRGILSRLDSELSELSDTDFADGLAKLLNEVAGAHGVWNIFSQTLSQREVETLAPPLDAADLVASDCYQVCMNKARNWRLVTTDGLREPPLVCLDAHYGPVAFSRQVALGDLRSSLRRYRDLRLPIPVVLLPADQTECIWLLPLLCHEVGHNVDQDLQLSGELTKALLIDSDGKIPSARQDVWYGWTREILADTIGVLLGTSGFALTLASLLLVLAPGTQQQDLNKYDPHPHPMLRIPLVCAMLRKLGVPSLNEAAGRMDRDWRSLRAPPWLAPFLDDIELVVETFLGKKLNALGGRALVELNPEITADVARAGALSSFLASGELRPAPDKPSYFPYRLVPTAAQLAVATETAPVQLAAVQQRAMDFIAAIPRPPMLAGARAISPQRARAYARLSQAVDFSDATVPRVSE